jgi:hypothetical protein
MESEREQTAPVCLRLPVDAKPNLLGSRWTCWASQPCWAKPPMKYSLRSLSIGITLMCVVLAARTEYLRRWAAYYEREAGRYYTQLGDEFGVSSHEVDEIIATNLFGKTTPHAVDCEISGHRFKFRFDNRLRNLEVNRDLAAAYRKTLPWEFVEFDEIGVIVP